MNATSVTMCQTIVSPTATVPEQVVPLSGAVALSDDLTQFLSLDFDDVVWSIRAGAAQAIAGELPEGVVADERDSLAYACLVTGRARGLRVRCGERMVAWPRTETVAPSFAAELLCVRYRGEAGWFVRTLWTADWVARRIGDRHFGLWPRAARMVTSVDPALGKVQSSIVDIKTEAWARLETTCESPSPTLDIAETIVPFVTDRSALFTADGAMVRRIGIRLGCEPASVGQSSIVASEMLGRFTGNGPDDGAAIAIWQPLVREVRFGRPECLSGAYCGRLWSAPAAG